MKIVLFTKLDYLFHHRRRMMYIDSLLISPAVYKQHSFRVIHRKKYS